MDATGAPSPPLRYYWKDHYGLRYHTCSGHESDNALNTRTVMLKDLLGNEMRLVLWGEHVVQFDAEAVCAMGHKESVIAIFVGTLPKTAHGNRGLCGSSSCHWYVDKDMVGAVGLNYVSAASR